MNPNIANTTITNKNVQNPLATGNSLFFVTPYDVTVGNPKLVAFYKIMMYIVDGFMAVIVLITGLKIMFVGTVFRRADAIEAITSMFVPLVAAHVGILIAAMFLGLNNVLSVDLYNWGEQNVQAPNVTTTSLNCYGRLQQRTCTNVQMNILDQFTITPSDLNLPGLGDALGSITNLSGLLVKILGLGVLASVIIRIFMINAYWMFSPVALALGGLPGKAGQPVTRAWLHGMISLSLVQTGQVVLLVIMQLALNLVAQHLQNIGSLNSDTLKNILEIVIDWSILRVPSLFNVAPMRMMTEAGQAMGQAAGASLAVGVAEIQFGVQAVTSVAGIAIAR